MSLETWLTNGWLVRFELSDQESDRLVLAARRELHDARQDISPESRFALAYNAALRLCSVVLGKAGYRAARDQKHYRSIAALPLILGQDTRELAAFLDACRSKRHEITYEGFDAVSEAEASELVGAAEELMARVQRR
jgi:uncharacterized protein (UPF0332 family)